MKRTYRYLDHPYYDEIADFCDAFRRYGYVLIQSEEPGSLAWEGAVLARTLAEERAPFIYDATRLRGQYERARYWDRRKVRA